MSMVPSGDPFESSGKIVIKSKGIKFNESPALTAKL